MSSMQRKVQTSLLFPEILWERPVHFYKSKAGKILVLAGSKGMHSSATVVCEAVFRSGTGVLTLGFPDILKSTLKDILPEAMTKLLPSTLSGSLAKRGEEEIYELSKAHDVVILGPGLSTNAETIQLVWQLIFRLEKPIVLSGDGLTALAKGIEVMRSKEDEDFLLDYFSNIKGGLIINAQSGDISRIISASKFGDQKKINAEWVVKHKEEAARLLSDKLGLLVVISDSDSVIADKENLIVNKGEGPSSFGNSDVLSGIIGSFIGQNPGKVIEATATAVYLFSLSAEIAKGKAGERTLIASDIIRYLPEAIKRAENEN